MTLLRMRRGAGIALLLAGAWAAGARGEEGLAERARRLARETLIVDTHLDTPGRLKDRWEDVSRRTARGQFDYPRAVQGGLDIPFMSIYTPSTLEGTGRARAAADALIEVVRRMERTWPACFRVVTSTAEVAREAGSGRVLLAMGMENGSPLEGNLDNVRYFHGRGIRYITLAHAKNNHLCDASYDTTRRWNGLSPFGRRVVGEMNRVGIMIDVSHLSDSAFYQVIRLSRAPVIASHSSCRHFTPGFERNMSDDMILALARNGGVLQINFGSEFLDDGIRREEEREQREVDAYLRRTGLSRADSAARRFVREYRPAHPRRHATVAAVADHIEHAVRLAGADHVGLGSDFDGVGDTLPTGLKDVSMYPNLLAELLRRGRGEEEIRKICAGNLLRVWSAVEREARPQEER